MKSTQNTLRHRNVLSPIEVPLPPVSHLPSPPSKPLLLQQDRKKPVCSSPDLLRPCWSESSFCSLWLTTRKRAHAGHVSKVPLSVRCVCRRIGMVATESESLELSVSFSLKLFLQGTMGSLNLGRHRHWGGFWSIRQVALVELLAHEPDPPSSAAAKHSSYQLTEVPCGKLQSAQFQLSHVGAST